MPQYSVPDIQMLAVSFDTVISYPCVIWNGAASECAVGNDIGRRMRQTYVVVQAVLFRNHAVAHVESVEEDTGRC